MAAVSQTSTEAGRRSWRLMPVTPDQGPGALASIGLIVLATDKASEPDVGAFLPPGEAVSLFSSRVPMEPVVTPETLAAMGDHLGAAVKLLLPDRPLDVIAYGCTTGSIAIGTEQVAAKVHAVRPGIPVTNPMAASIKGLGRLGCSRVSVLTPYPDDVNAMLEGYLTDAGLDLADLGSFKQRGDPEINAVSPQSIYEAGLEIGGGDSEALFISCTALRTSGLVGRLEAALGKPVVTSNQALAWDSLRLAGYEQPQSGFGRLMELAGG